MSAGDTLPVLIRGGEPVYPSPNLMPWRMWTPRIDAPCAFSAALGDLEVLLRRCDFTGLEIESIIWAKGHLGPEPVEISRKQNLVGMIGGSIALAVIFGCVGVYYGGGFRGIFSTNRRESRWASDRVMSDYRTPKEAYGIPFLIGAGFGAVVPWLAAAARRRKTGEDAV